MKFDMVIADPPWIFSDELKMSDVKRGAESQYSVMTIEDIKNLKVKDVVKDDALLALWVPSSLLQEGLDVMKCWGFRQTQTHIWVKVKNEPFSDLVKEFKKQIKEKDAKEIIEVLFENFKWNGVLGFFMGRLFRQCHEVCLIGVRGKIYNKLQNKSQRSVHFAPNLKHSAKPEELQDMLDLMFPDCDKKLEMFARRDRQGWYCAGIECPSTMGEDIRNSIEKLNKL